ncbi:regulation of nuclear pre-mRNA domain-containing protein 1B-like isoform X1 [Mercenaria mercenaria]|uniref:regulation of nuclear pre-mRNA domain-containing protein 1B-like isoform X2 n=1 Tax=Mercenaria mercenaria TaxID=6596 RepID=UPI001E1D3569|nr:regulation of nuclear pre-mRNA domain-containing protein 1B-like isoform X2 [Mercenaria mercenaria]XP_053401613.1 regulation of nuclear pre-mRNA domain-containing protein 1B-like isoform X1 [Mercenaria mercenaria]
MSSFSDSNLAKKLNELNGTQQSIQTLSLWLIHHRKHSKTIVQVWLRELKKVTPPRRLIYIYLANDVIQNSKKKGPEFTHDFGTVMAEAFTTGYKDAGEKQRGSLDRILNIWEDRGVYTKDFMKNLRQGIASGQTATHTAHIKDVFKEDILAPRKEPNPKEVAPKEVIPRKRRRKDEPEQTSLKQELDAMKHDELATHDNESLIKRLSALENSASCDAAIREKIAKLPPEVSDISQLAKLHDKDSARRLSNTVDNACVLLTDYNRRLAEELEERKGVAKLLRAFINTQTEQLGHAEKRLQEYKNKLAKVNVVRHELKSHIQNLPDISRLPDPLAGLAPLPKVNDLFGH